MSKPSLLLLGAGNMGGALFDAWVAEQSIDFGRSAVVDPKPTDAIVTLCEENGIALNPERDSGYDVCVLAVKPQMFASVLPDLDWPSFEETLFLSIAAGQTIEGIRQLLAERAPQPRVVRTMPGLPAKVRRAVTLIADHPDLTEDDRRVATDLMAAAGETYWCEDEDHLDRVMGVTGCSPAFVFLLAEALTEAALEQGVGPEDARRIAEASVVGAAAMLEVDGREAGALRRAVTSPNGTTQAALDILNDPERGFRPLVSSAARNAYDRAKELAGGR